MKKKDKGKKKAKKRVAKKRAKSKPKARSASTFSQFLSRTKKLSDRVIMAMGDSKGDIRGVSQGVRTSRTARINIVKGSQKAYYVPFLRFLVELKGPFEKLMKPTVFETPYYDSTVKKLSTNIRVASYRKRFLRPKNIPSGTIRLHPQIAFKKTLEAVKKQVPSRIFRCNLDKKIFSSQKKAESHSTSLLERERAREITKKSRSFSKRITAVQRTINKTERDIERFSKKIDARSKDKTLRKQLIDAKRNLKESVSKQNRVERELAKAVTTLEKSFNTKAKKSVIIKKFIPSKANLKVMAEILVLPNWGADIDVSTKRGSKRFHASIRFDGTTSIGKCFSCNKELDEASQTFICTECGELLCHFDANQCRICKAPLCGMHQHICTGCTKMVCDGCMRKCPSCNRRICKDCLKKCNNCAAQICVLCEVKSSSMMVKERDKCMNCNG